MKTIILLAQLTLLAGCTSTMDQQPAPSRYADEQARAIKALSPDEITAYRAGEGMGLAMAAELNHYPGPKHALEHADDLHLTDAQRKQMTQTFDEMNAAAVAIGEQIIEHETVLDALFSERKVGTDSLQKVLQGIGELQADLRFTHLNAHLIARSILSEAQVVHYDLLRGYTSMKGGEHDHSTMKH